MERWRSPTPSSASMHRSLRASSRSVAAAVDAEIGQFGFMVLQSFAEIGELTCLPPRLLEKPGGSGMLDADLDGRGMGEFSATTHSGGGGGGRDEDMAGEMSEGVGEKKALADGPAK